MSELKVLLTFQGTGQWSKLYINDVFLGVFNRKDGGWIFEPVIGTCTTNWDSRKDAQRAVIQRYCEAQ